MGVLVRLFLLSFLHLATAGEQRIINGSIALPSEYPFAVAIIHDGTYQCAGSLISDKHVLSAAHCFVNALILTSAVLLPVQTLELSLGSRFYSEGTLYKVQKVLLHPKFDHEHLWNDIALAQSPSTIKTNENVRWVPLSPMVLMDDSGVVTGTTMGWGFTNKGKEMVPKKSAMLRSVTLQSVPLGQCKRWKPFITRNNICMTGAQKGTCTGDSGGPLVRKINKVFYQIGIVSYGADCNNTTPEVYTRISSFYNWIKSTVNLPHPLTGYSR